VGRIPPLSGPRSRYGVRGLGDDREGDRHRWSDHRCAFAWQNAYAERLIESIRRECLDHIIVANERGLRRVLHAYVDYYLKSRTHLALGKDAPVSRLVAPPGNGAIVALPHLSGLHHRYERRAA